MKYVIIMWSIMLFACGTAQVATVDGGAVPDAVDAGSVLEDAATEDGGTDSGSLTDSGRWTTDAGRQDAGAQIPDAWVGSDAGVPDAAVQDAGSPDAYVRPSRPVGAAVDVTGEFCALDEAGNFWCWNRWATPGELRLLGSGYVHAAGTCAQTPAGAVHCAVFGTQEMVSVMSGDTVLVVEHLVEYSDLALGCGIRGVDLWCWTDGTATRAYAGAPGDPVIEAAVTSASTGAPREYRRRTMGLDLNYHYCEETGFPGSFYYQCYRPTGTGYSLRPGLENRVVAFAFDCETVGGASRCWMNATTSVVVPGSGVFHDHQPAAVGVRGICRSDDVLRCYRLEVGGGVATFVLDHTVSW